MNDFVGVFGAPDPVAGLALLGVEPVWHDGAVAFAGAPVWADFDGSVVVSGEVVLDNAAQLRDELGRPYAEPLELMGVLYLRHGAQLGQYALGMYAVAIWDATQQQLTLLRDGVGARTLYYATSGATWWFAARLSALARCPAVTREISLTALRDYLSCAFVPGAQTMWRDVQELRPGASLILPEGKTESYWEPTESEWNPADPIEAHAARLRPLLQDAVTARLPASGPVGVFLSGGLDSSLVTALAARALR